MVYFKEITGIKYAYRIDATTGLETYVGHPSDDDMKRLEEAKKEGREDEFWKDFESSTFEPELIGASLDFAQAVKHIRGEG